MPARRTALSAATVFLTCALALVGWLVGGRDGTPHVSTGGAGVQIADDPLNLIAADGSQSAAKGDSGPAAWLPADPGIRCAYAVRFAQVPLKYRLPVTEADKRAMLEQCAAR